MSWCFSKGFLTSGWLRSIGTLEAKACAAYVCERRVGREPGSWCTVYVTLKDTHSETWHKLLHSWQPSRFWATRNVCCILKRCHLSWSKSESTSWAITAVLWIIFTFCNNSATCIFQNHSQVFFPCHFTVSRWHKLINVILQISSDEELSLREIK